MKPNQHVTSPDKRALMLGSQSNQSSKQPF